MKTKKTLTSTVIAALAVLLVFTITALSLTGCSDGGSPASHTHQWGAWQVTTAATCAAAGVETRVCALDASHKDTREIAIDPTAHNYGAWTETTAPTETAEGEETRVCSHNAAHSETRPVAVHTHQWGVWTQTKAATENEEGEETRTCTLDPTHTETRVIAALSHVHVWGEWAVTTAATCVNKGEEKRVCTLNSTHYETQDIAINSTAHNYGAWTQTTAPTCTTAGVDTRTCSHDAAHKETRAGAAAIGHNFANYTQTTAPTCTEAGIETGTCTHDAAHKETRAGAAALGHDYVWTVTTPATYPEEGVETEICSHNTTHTRGTRPIAKLKITITFNSNEGSSVAPITNLEHGNKIDKPADPSKSGYYCIFVNWYKEAAFTNLWDFANDTVTANTTLYAKWDAYSIGDTGPGGGKIFYRIEAGFTHYQTATDTTGITAHYLEAAPNDMATTLAWASSGFTSSDIVGTVTAIGTGMKNTALILATNANAPAAKACKDSTDGGKTDWFLPSVWELNQLYVNKSTVGNLASFVYWSSSQVSSNYAWRQNLSDGGYQTDSNKYYDYNVRAIRAF